MLLSEPSQKLWFQVEVGSIYACLAALLRDGLVSEISVDRHGNRPERTNYRITLDGRVHLRDLIKEAWSHLPSMTEPINTALAATTELDASEFTGFLLDREFALTERLRQIESASRSAHSQAMVRRVKRLTEAELDWVHSELGEHEENE